MDGSCGRVRNACHCAILLIRPSLTVGTTLEANVMIQHRQATAKRQHEASAGRRSSPILRADRPRADLADDSCDLFPRDARGKIWRDEVNLTKPELQTLDGLRSIWFDPATTAKDSQYYPLVHTAFWIEHKLWGDAFLGYHLINVVEHSLAVLLVYLVLKKLQIPGAFLPRRSLPSIQ